MRRALAGVLLVLLAVPVGADARTWYGRVTSFDDGDTVKVDIGRRHNVRVRITGIQAMEQTVYSNTPSRRRGECHALEATARLEQLIRRGHRRVRLTAQRASSHAKQRLRRSLAVRIGGRWRDAGRILLAEGHALWLPQFVETAKNAEYSRIAQRAATRGVGIWNPTSCGAGPSEGAPLRVTVNPKHTGSDLDIPGEWVRIRSFAPYPVPLGGWWVRDSGLRRYVFPQGITLPPNGALTLHVGTGTNRGSDLFWGLHTLVFEDPPLGDGAYLFDPQGDLRAWMTYPCRYACTDPYQGAVRLGAQGRGADEQVTLRNIGSGAVDLDGYRLESPPYKYVFGTDAALAPGETMVLEVQGSPAADTRLVKHWGKSKRILDDGDTIYVKVDGDTTHSIRFTGVNAMEQTVYSSNPARRRGFCHALAATSRIEGLIRRAGGRVRLAAIDASSASRKRWRRAVAVKIGGRWRDLGRILVSEGLALWLPNGNEWVWNAEYSELAERAAAAHRGIWNPTACGRGPQDSIPLRLDVNGDADGSDDENVNGEWIRIHNLDPAKTLRLGGWYVRDTAPPRYVLPDWVTVPPGEELTVHVGRGTNTFTELFWGLKKGIFDNAGSGGHGVGDGAFLFDPQGDLRAWMTYPCRLNCTDPYQGLLDVTADGQGSEHVNVRNIGTTTLDLDGYKLSTPPHVYAFGPNTTLAPGEELRVQVVGDPDEDGPLVKYWGKPGTILDDAGDVVRLLNMRGVVLDCFAYGAATC